MIDIAKLQADQQALKDSVDALGAAVTANTAVLNTEVTTITAQSATIADLKAQLAAGQPITSDQLDALDATLVGSATNIKAAADQLTAAAAAISTPATVVPPVSDPDPTQAS